MTWYVLATQKDKITKKKKIYYIQLQFIKFIDAQRLNCLSFMDKVGFTCFPERITPIFKFFNRNQKHMIVGMIAGKKVF